MRHGRAKAARRTLRFFQLNAGIKPPYTVLIDGNFLAASIRQKVREGHLHQSSRSRLTLFMFPFTSATFLSSTSLLIFAHNISQLSLNDRIEKVLQGAKCNLYVARSALDELGSLPGPVFEQARRLGLDECEIIENDSLPPPSPQKTDGKEQQDPSSEISASEAIHRLVTAVENGVSNPRKFFLATQDAELAEEIRSNAANVPILRISQSVLLLEVPSSSSRKQAARDERSKQAAGTLMTSEEREMVKAVKEQVIQTRKAQETQSIQMTRRVKPKAKAPNPLSCKKKRKAAEETGISAASKNRKRKRTKNSSNTTETIQR